MMLVSVALTFNGMVGFQQTAPPAAAGAPQCLHGANETPEQKARRAEAVRVARVVNSTQASHGAKKRTYLTHAEFASAYGDRAKGDGINLQPGEEVLPGWELQLDVTPTSYWFMVKDKTDPCGFAYISNRAGLIFSAEPIR